MADVTPFPNPLLLMIEVKVKSTVTQAANGRDKPKLGRLTLSVTLCLHHLGSGINQIG